MGAGITAWLVVLGSWCILFCSIGTFQKYSPITISWIPSLQVFMFGMGPIVGKLYDLFGALLHVFSLMMASLDTKYYQLLLSQGPAMGFRRRGAAYGIVSTGSRVSGVWVLPIMVSRLMGSVGYAWTDAHRGVLRARGTRTGKKMSRESLVRPFREVKMVLLVLGVYVFDAVDAGMTAALAQQLVAILNAGSLLGRLSAGVCSDRVGTYNIFVCVVFLAGVVVLGLWIPAAGNAAIIVFAVVFGFTNTGAYVSLAPALVEIGYRTGLMFLFASVGGLTTSPIGGMPFCSVFSGVMLLVGTEFVMAARVVRTGWVLKAKL
ncbi:uncharacterized protein P174DRAFT_511660 [Aspergillus novofumigatus IBT 16806]|uniref:MFS general substrate transporter n=1 Tax=Aspergillus novofumigatus (strain IBT 16806) TaxID=1392255 RepID=A0A2I1CEG7_ASPN1|nr:uncharacterized protein P174DRAFT_511660 [Aspergillus novofumigatus IBT 16806]PKX96019.1 hypothetical protein P174DRAFT_511660 [Aspergillus novofumigatus IBT 16806]